MKLIKPTKQQLNDMNMDHSLNLIHPEMRPFLINRCGDDHYRLLNYIGMNFDGVIYEMGTHLGASSTCLSNWGKRKVITYDINRRDIFEIPSNEYRTKNPLEDIVEISKADFIFYDTSHDGKTETEFTNALIENKFSGIVLYDDIYLNDSMKNFWESLTVVKEDWTDIGHYSGTGIAYFKNE